MSTDPNRQDSTNADWIGREILIPKASFTAFRLLYGDAQEISHVSRVVLLGSIPKLWYREQNSSILKAWTKASYSRFQKTVRNVGSRVNSTYKFGATELYKDQNVRRFLFLSNQLGDEEEEDGDKSDTDDTTGGNGGRRGDCDEDDSGEYPIARDILNKDFSEPLVGQNLRRASTTPLPRNIRPKPVENTIEYNRKKLMNEELPCLESAKTQALPRSSNSVPLISIQDDSSHSIQNPKRSIMQLPDSTVQTFYSASENITNTNAGGINDSIIPELNDRSTNASTNSTNTVKPATPESFQSTRENLEITAPTRPRRLSSSTNTSEQESAFSIADHPRVRFQPAPSDSAASRQRSAASAQFLKPEPEDNPIILPLDPRHERALQKIKAVATRTKRHVQNDIHNINQRRIFQKLLKNYKVGEIIKMEKMLVLVKQTINSNNMMFTTFTEVEPCDTRILERWKEYIVVARSTGNFDEPILIQLYTKREIPHGETSKHSDDDLDFTLNNSCLINFYSSLDKTISIVKKGKVYILRCQTPTSSVSWLTFLNETLGNSTSGIFKIQIPKLSISINIKVTTALFQKLIDEEDTKYTKVLFKYDGYYAKELPILEYLVQKIKSKLVRAGYGNLVENWNKQNLVLAFCWRHYDRLVWIFGETLSNLFWQQSMYSTHDLEVRVSQHYPQEVITEERELLREPSPIEGFLARLSSRNGNNRNILHKQIFKFSYFYTSNHLFFFCRSYKALPPIPNSEYLSDPKFLSNPENFERIRSNIPLVYEHNPYHIDKNGHIKWLNPTITLHEFSEHDHFASYEFERRVASIVRADSVIDMLDIVEVKAINSDSLPAPVRAASNYAWEESTEHIRDENDETKDSFFRIELQNGSVFTLKAPNRTIRTEWVLRLTELVRYWKLRIEEDVKKIHEVKFSNIARLNIDDYMEANVGEATPKWENSRGIADPSIHNISSNAMFRPIVRCGMLYQKPKKHSVFKNYFVCLIPGFVILYKIFVRTINGLAVPTTHYKHYLTIPLDECYIYSGNTSGIDLLKRDSVIDRVNLGRNSLPRIYKDGWISSEDEASRCFTLWFGTKRAIAGKMMIKNNEGFNEYGSQNPGIMKMVNRLGVTGRSMVFMCRSRQERDLWVSNIYTEVERFHKEDDNTMRGVASEK